MVRLCVCVGHFPPPACSSVGSVSLGLTDVVLVLCAHVDVLVFPDLPCTWSCAKAGYRAEESDPTERNNLRRWQAVAEEISRLEHPFCRRVSVLAHGGRRGGWLLPRVHPCGCVLVVSHVRLMWYTVGEEKGSEGLQASIP